MTDFVCEKCGCVDNISLVANAWTLYLSERDMLCSECSPEQHKWHERFPKKEWDGLSETLNRPFELTIHLTTFNGILLKPIDLVRYKSCEIHLSDPFEDERCIQLIKNKDNRYDYSEETVRRLIEELRADNITLVSSPPLTEEWRKIIEKYDLKIYE
jgi:hypothetical protein